MYAGRIVEGGPVDRIFARPAHPYTEALIAAVPKLYGHQGKLRTIPGQPPAPTDVVIGCPFAPRCDKADNLCRSEAPLTVSAGADHKASCWKVEQA